MLRSAKIRPDRCKPAGSASQTWPVYVVNEVDATATVFRCLADADAWSDTSDGEGHRAALGVVTAALEPTAAEGFPFSLDQLRAAVGAG